MAFAPRHTIIEGKVGRFRALRRLPTLNFLLAQFQLIRFLEGLIQREAVFPYTFPRKFGTIVSYAMNKRRDAVYQLSALPRFAPWLFRYWQNSTPERVKHSAQALAPLMAKDRPFITAR